MASEDALNLCPFGSLIEHLLTLGPRSLQSSPIPGKAKEQRADRSCRMLFCLYVARAGKTFQGNAGGRAIFSGIWLGRKEERLRAESGEARTRSGAGMGGYWSLTLK